MNILNYRVTKDGEVRTLSDEQTNSFVRGEIHYPVVSYYEAQEILRNSSSPAAKEIYFSIDDAAAAAWEIRMEIASKTLSPAAMRVIRKVVTHEYIDISTYDYLQALEDGAALAEMGFGDADTEAVNEAYEFLGRWRKADC